jgi:hypothetical protein
MDVNMSIYSSSVSEGRAVFWDLGQAEFISSTSLDIVVGTSNDAGVE